jgi:hypothetical protein
MTNDPGPTAQGSVMLSIMDLVVFEEGFLLLFSEDDNDEDDDKTDCT